MNHIGFEPSKGTEKQSPWWFPLVALKGVIDKAVTGVCLLRQRPRHHRFKIDAHKLGPPG
jgi:hypothetical protein